jgi:hypothetical protein
MSARHGRIIADWSRAFEDTITLPDGRTLSTLRDAGDYITSLPKAEPLPDLTQPPREE